MTYDIKASSASLVAACIMALAASTNAFSAPVAYVDRYSPTDAKFHIERAGRRLPRDAGNTDLEVGDQLYVDTPEAVIMIRYIANNDVVTVRRTTRQGGDVRPDLTVGPSSLPGVTGVLLAWLKTELSTADRGGISIAATRGAAPTGVCFNESGRTDDPTLFNIPVLKAARSRIVSGRRYIFVSWRGGAAPYTVMLTKAGTDQIVAQSTDIRGTCSVRLPTEPLGPGLYKLTVADANNAKEGQDSLFVVHAAPPMPQPLHDAQISNEARNLYYATWLTAIDSGEWAFEAQQFVAGMDCRSTAVREWLRRWGDVPDCH